MEQNDSNSPENTEQFDEQYGIVPVRYRYDGWVPDRQLEFIEALSSCGCIEQAARSVGMSKASAYALRQRPDAEAFRLAWDAALDYSVSRLADAAMARAIHGVAIPIFHKGEQVGERRHYNERLTMFLLRSRYPEKYGKMLEQSEPNEYPDYMARTLGNRIARMLRNAAVMFLAALEGRAAPEPDPEVIIHEKRKKTRKD